jgi:hypothetical protein
MQSNEKIFMDAAAIGTTVGSLGEILPPIASLFTIIWMALRIFETPTVQSWFGKNNKGSTDDEHGSTD